MSPNDSSQNELFLRGAQSYLDALTAIAAFRGEVQSICTDIYDHYKEELATQLGLDIEECEPYAEDDPDMRHAEVGIWRPAQPDCTFCLYLKWEEDGRGNGKILGCVFLGLYRTRLRDEIFDRFRQQRQGCRVEKSKDSYCLILYESLNDLAATREVLNALVVEWLQNCKSIGGLNLKGRQTI